MIFFLYVVEKVLIKDETVPENFQIKRSLRLYSRFNSLWVLLDRIFELQNAEEFEVRKRNLFGNLILKICEKTNLSSRGF